MRNVLVFFGGKSCEHDISVITGVMTVNLVDSSKFNSYPIFVDKDGKFYTGEILKNIEFYKNIDYKRLKEVTIKAGSDELYLVSGKRLKKLCSIYCAISCMHGVNGEDGSLVGYLQTCDVPCASPDMFCSSFAIDKERTKILLNGLKVKRLPYVKISRTAFFKAREKEVVKAMKIGFPLIVKPARLGSSIGIKIASDKLELEDAIIEAFNYDGKIIVEKAVENFIEINCAAYLKEGEIIVSELERPISSHSILTFEDKYLSEGDREFPAKLNDELTEKIKSLTKTIYEKLGFIGVIRIDYILFDGEVYLNEINTVPGSLAYYLFCDTMKEFSDMITTLIEEGVKRNLEENKFIRVYSSNALTKGLGKGNKRLTK